MGFTLTLCKCLDSAVGKLFPHQPGLFGFTEMNSYRKALILPQNYLLSYFEG